MERHLASVSGFVEQLLNSGATLVNLAENLVAALEQNGSERDEALADILEMLVGTIALRFAPIPVTDVDRAAELTALALEAVFADLERALKLARRREQHDTSRIRR